MVKKNSKCEECNDIGSYNKYFNKYLCILCRNNNNNYILITKTTAKREYLLTEDDLNTIKPFDGKCKSSYGPATYNIKNNIINLACTKHDVNLHILEEKISQIKTNKYNKKRENELKKEEQQKELKIKRKNKLISRLNKAGLNFRNDSELCKKYINGSKEFSLDYIIERMSQMKYLYEYCYMDKCKEIAHASYCDEINAGYFPDCSVFDHAEYIALTKYSNGKYPDEFPWQKK